MATAIFVVLFILNIRLCFIVAEGWARKGLRYGEGFACSFFFSGVVGALIGILYQPKYITKVCPSCGESVKKAALICKYCRFKFGI